MLLPKSLGLPVLLITILSVHSSQADAFKKIVKKGLPFALLPLGLAGFAHRGHSEKPIVIPPHLPQATQVKIITVPQPVPIPVPVHHHHRHIVKHHHHKGKTKIVHVPRPVKKKHKLAYSNLHVASSNHAKLGFNELANFDTGLSVRGTDGKKLITDFSQNLYQNVDTIKLGSGGYNIGKHSSISFPQPTFDEHKNLHLIQHSGVQQDFYPKQSHQLGDASKTVLGDTVDLTKDDSHAPDASRHLEFFQTLGNHQKELFSSRDHQNIRIGQSEPMVSHQPNFPTYQHL